MLKNIDHFRPSEHTAALIQALRTDVTRVQGTSVLEIGSGSGVILAFLASAGAKSLCGVDIEKDAVAAGTALLRGMALSSVFEFHCGDMWEPVRKRKFNLVVANLPHFPMEHAEVSDRLSSWSVGGPDGRTVLDPFLKGLKEHLLPGGRAVITHNAFVDIERTREVLEENDMALQIIETKPIHIPAEKLVLMSDHIRHAQNRRTIHCDGSRVFGDVHIVEITAQNKDWKKGPNPSM